MITPRQRRTTILLIIAILILLLAWVLYVLFSKPKPVPEPVEPVVSVSVIEEPVKKEEPTISELNLQKEQVERVQAADVIMLSKLFVVRYGSFSNDAEFANITDVIPLMSQAFAASTTAGLANRTASTDFYGITTRVITVKVKQTNEKEGTATVVVSTQRVEENGSAQNTSIKYQDMELMFVKESGVWKVDSAKWL